MTGESKENAKDSVLDLNQYSYYFSLIELTSEQGYDQVYVSGSATELEIMGADWFQEYSKGKGAVSVDASWYRTDGYFDGAENTADVAVKIPTKEELELLTRNLTDINFYLIGSCEFQFSIENTEQDVFER